jgi:protein involved in polysaccharide export with SLBB domain
LNNVFNDTNSPDNQLLQPGDVVTVFSTSDIRVPISKRRIMVRIEGEVAKPGVYQAKPGESLSAIVQRAGGLTHDAYLYGSGFYRDEVKKSQQENLQKLLKRLESELNTALTQASQSLGAASNVTATQARVLAAQVAQKQAIDRLKNLKPEGRIALGLAPDLYNRVDKLPEIRMQNGDRFMIPAKPDFIYVYGSVNTESALLFKPEKTVNDYLQLSGLGSGADRNGVILVRADGSALTNNSSWSNSVLSTKLMPGDSIVIPEKLDQESAWSSVIRNTVDITQIFYQLGLGAAAIKVLQ